MQGENMGMMLTISDNPSNSFGWVLYMAKEYAGMFLEGTWTTLYMAVIGTVLGFFLGFALGIIGDSQIRKEDNIIKKVMLRIIKIVFSIYIEIFRDTPMIVQAMVFFYGLRSFGVQITPIPAGILVIFLNTGAYMSETVRAGINSIDIGQREGAYALGMSPLKTMFIVVLPQALRNIIPEMANMFLTNLKMTSVLNVIGVSELFLVAKTTGAIYYKYFEAYLVIAAIYFVLCFVCNRLFIIMEKKLEGKKDYVLAVEFMDDGQ
ncbi:MAG: amino acid ABC transporter permease [Lachnospiraceae bacterium]